MTLTPGPDPLETSRQRTRDQFGLLDESPGGSFVIDSDDPADFGFICDSDHVLLPPPDPDGNPEDDAVTRLTAYLSGRGDDFEDLPPDSSDQPQQPAQPRAGLSRRFRLPRRRVPVDLGRDLLVTLDELDRDFGVGFATPDHFVHICPKASLCPATEPTETGAGGPWPPVNDDRQAGAGVRVVVVDTGWYAPEDESLPWWWLQDVDGEPEPNGVFSQGDELRPYAGHGTFVSGVVRAMAPGCSVHVLSLQVDPTFPGGGVLESDLVNRLYDALDLDEDPPDLVNLSAGCTSRLNLPSRAFEDWRADVRRNHPDLDMVLVAAAGNNASPWGFWPASFSWAVGVGSLDRDGTVSSYSNWGDSVDVFALGRNLVNAFPDGHYTCHERPDRGDERIFDHWLARWSGTSFSAPLVTGLIAAAMTGHSPSIGAAEARDEVLGAQHRMPALTARHVPVVRDDLLVPVQPS
jgi:subtilisin family serine protease